jgi:hypothetical protein
MGCLNSKDSSKPASASGNPKVSPAFSDNSREATPNKSASKRSDGGR